MTATPSAPFARSARAARTARTARTACTTPWPAVPAPSDAVATTANASPTTQEVAS
jgi:hypothetical protein